MSRISIIQVASCRETRDGDGATVFRVIGTSGLRHYDPFLMLDEFHVRPPAGFPDHPHRGFETVTYMLGGAFKHKDFVGHQGIIETGDLQWMTAGRGIVHSEMPAADTDNYGLQLWVNLAARDKMIPPNYQELKAKDIPVAKKEGVEVKVIAGKSLGVESKVYTRTPTMYLDVVMEKNSKFEQEIPEEFRGFVYVLEGSGMFGETRKVGNAHQMLLFDEGNELCIETAEQSCRFVIIAGKPIGEPIVQYGPFVMNTQDEIQQAFYDYQLRQNGFEGSNNQ
jgi:redox-sensitive bicupin YhaK (pirin superfamily)